MSLNGKFGYYIDKTGKEVIPLKYDLKYDYDNMRDSGDFSEGLASVKLNGKFGYIDKTGKEIVPLKYDAVRSFESGLARVYVWEKNKGLKYGFIDKTGKEVIPLKYDYDALEYGFNSGNFIEGLARVSLNGKWGYIDKTGKEVIPFKYDDITLFSEGLAMVVLNGKCGYVDKTGKEITPLKYDVERVQ